ncbi:head morphogenesis [Clostridium phage phiCTP1]|uniref:head morphogenesis n=1 Tax=Clostridium phage phiCTP1 TaxID=871584 RepID=UPI0001E07814|nr:head morphogenesis [Clostridium phage phiCTP1]ADL40307.1 putative head morphogenesis protein [Clostridium phage phiCTP1]
MGYEEDLYRALNDSKIKLTKTTAQKIRRVYINTAKELIKRFKSGNKSSLNKIEMAAYLRGIRPYLKDLNLKINDIGSNAFKESSKLYTEIYGDVLQSGTTEHIPQDVIDMLFSVPNNIIEGLLKGKLYKDGIGLSKRIWNINNKYAKDIQTVLAEGIAQHKTYNEMMEDLAKYVNPDAKKDWSWSKVYPGTNKQVDYNAQRLMRTGINHMYYLSNVAAVQNDPFIDAMHWELSSQHEIRQVIPFGPDICDYNAKQDNYNLGTGNFPVNKVPVPHPNCLCTQYATFSQDLEQIGKHINRWIRGTEPNPALDKSFDNWKADREASDIFTTAKRNSTGDYSYPED